MRQKPGAGDSQQRSKYDLLHRKHSSGGLK
jgi:hypothetical protein